MTNCTALQGRQFGFEWCKHAARDLEQDSTCEIAQIERGKGKEWEKEIELSVLGERLAQLVQHSKLEKDNEKAAPVSQMSNSENYDNSTFISK